ncbi:Ubiquitin-like modifier-activating enzyme [Phytophthora fragariae]|uniref:Ubiquitin-like modifier-activating enzyme ATG7 n=1 Tax=Phytophthora fragariae TaxID=53985 RepID=A0A6A3RQ30_9STRA|nr:Ubiquitin-like modifier-activating enzyme [Phytophthora fragariae]KAE8933572.1 Ubiquitin-like modifier-activating enzyme [Phytophthora fragariae]KAE9000985.1 Ubiquitin-like modifier-activating enzyme [Phytophthora fragariae]KAE9101182.1 Ubiquitin-like modifier-activating enzyme [Phytophthora fragariae]KAE9103389.1 Ubiquitin-like modifier-activating enzyme [Phytophthora fragariae]
MADWQVLKFQPWNSAPDVSFWQTLTSLKLDKFQLDDQAQAVTGYFTPGRSQNVPARFTIDESAFPTAEGAQTDSRDTDRARYEWGAPGLLFNTNTLEAFKSLDKAKLLKEAGDKILDLVLSDERGGVSIDHLNSFVLITFADLKKHSFLYWFGFPALSPPMPFQCRSPPAAVSSVLSAKEQVQTLRGLLKLRRVNGETHVVESNFASFFVLERLAESASSEQVVRVSDVQKWRAADHNADGVVETLFGFVDPCPLKTNPGWPLRNFLALLTALPAEKVDRSRPLKIISFREHVHQFTEVPDDFEWRSSVVFEVKSDQSFMANGRSRQDVRVTGWEANVRAKMGPRMMELGGILDPIRLAETSVDLNLKLMRWRQLPSLNLELLAQTKCLLLGAGTLGCYTARSLLSWGLRNITFVDNSTVSHSNPVRQPLFEFNDVGKPKGECAANALKRIFPLVNSQAVHLTIPMAGHALSSPQLVEEARKGLETLEQLIESHDVIFLGTDSRESRWLPTVIASSKKKLLLNAALGFDSYLVMRHGVHPDHEHGPSLGCYFCNDIVSPRDSLKDRTLDQMCTVTRPGLAPIAAATAVELLVAVLHSPQGKYVGAEKPSDGSAPMGYIPHQLRGFLNAFQNMVITGEAFDKCIACSSKVIDAYSADALGLLEKACNSTAYLEELTGLNQLTEEADSLMIELEDSDEDGDMV